MRALIYKFVSLFIPKLLDYDEQTGNYPVRNPFKKWFRSRKP